MLIDTMFLGLSKLSSDPTFSIALAPWDALKFKPMANTDTYTCVFKDLKMQLDHNFELMNTLKDNTDTS